MLYVMVYKTFESMINRILEVREYKAQALVVLVGIFSSLLYSSVFGGKFGIVIAATSIIVLGTMVLSSGRSLVNLSENGPIKQVIGSEARLWGVFYLIFGITLLFFYFN